MPYEVVALPGDGIGPEVMVEGLKVLHAVAGPLGLDFDVKEIPCGGRYYLEHGTDWPEGSLDACAAADVILLGAVGWPDPSGNGPVMMPDGNMAGWSPVIGNRTRLDLHANIRPVKLYAGVRHRIHGELRRVWEPGKVDIAFVRENTEGLYSGAGGILAPGGRSRVAVDSRIITREGSEKVIRTAFELCSRRKTAAPSDGRKRVTCIVKDNVLTGCRLFRDVFFEIGDEYPDIEKETALVDAFTQWLIGRPEHYDVCVTTNMFGDIVTDLASVLQGGMGMAVGANVGEAHGMFEPIHGSAPKYTGQDMVNPMAMILAVKEALEWLAHRTPDAGKLQAAAAAVEQAVVDVLEKGAPLTYDLVGREKAARCSEVGTAVAKAASHHVGRVAAA